MRTTRASAFQYELADVSPFLVVHFHGAITQRARTKLLDCSREILARRPGHIILDFANVEQISNDALIELKRFRGRIKRAKADIEIACPSPAQARLLIKAAIVRREQISEEIELELFHSLNQFLDTKSVRPERAPHLSPHVDLSFLENYKKSSKD